MAYQESTEHSHFGARQVGPVAMTRDDVKDYQALHMLGINLGKGVDIAQMISFAMDDQQGGITTASITNPIQFLQNWLPGFVHTITAARKIDELVGLTTSGSWEDEEIVQGVLEPIGGAVLYGDYTDVPLSSWNVNWERRTVVRFEKGIKVGRLEEARTARIRVNSGAEKRAAAAIALEVQRNIIGFSGYNNGVNRTYGFLNDPALPAYYNVANGAAGSPLWSRKVFLEITADIRQAMAQLQTQTQDTISPESAQITLALPTSVYQYLTVSSDFGYSVRDWIKDNYPNLRIVSAPQLNAANGGANVGYLYAESVTDGGSDDGRTFVQVVPAKFQALGVEQNAKSYVEDYVNATAGVMCKRPFAVVRFSGI